MKQSWTWVKPLLAAFCCLSLFMSLVGCYEGWKRPPGAGGEGGDDQSNKPVPQVDPPIGFVIFDVIRPSAGALRDPNCFLGSSSLAEYRVAEWDARVAALEETLKSMAESVRRVDTEITPEDCRKLQSLEVRSLNTIPDLPKASALKKAVAIHIKAIFLDEDIPFSTATLAPSVRRQDWPDVFQLQRLGFKKMASLHYSVLSGSIYGNFQVWRDSLPYEARLSGTPIYSPKVTSEGLEEIQKTTAKDTRDFTTWLATRVPK